MTEAKIREKIEAFEALVKRAEMADVAELKATHMTALQITDDPATLRTILHEMIEALRGKDGRAGSREKALAVTKLQEAMFWLMEDQARS
jgi:hypothetical protein